MKSSRPFTMDQAESISHQTMNTATSYSARHSSRRFKFVFTKDLAELTRLSFSTDICHIGEFSSRDLTDLTRFSFSTTNCHIVEYSSRRLVRHSSRRLFMLVFTRHLAELTRFSFSTTICYIVEFSSRNLVLHNFPRTPSTEYTPLTPRQMTTTQLPLP